MLVAARVGSRLTAEGTSDEVRAASRLPYVGVTVDEALVAATGMLTGTAASLPLDDGSLVIGLRTGKKRLGPADERVLALLAGPLSAAVHATRLSEQLQVSRERLVLARQC